MMTHRFHVLLCCLVSIFTSTVGEFSIAVSLASWYDTVLSCKNLYCNFRDAEARPVADVCNMQHPVWQPHSNITGRLAVFDVRHDYPPKINTFVQVLLDLCCRSHICKWWWWHCALAKCWLVDRWAGTGQEVQKKHGYFSLLPPFSFQHNQE